MVREFETEITIDLETGDILLNRDHKIMLEIAESIMKDEQLENFKKFFDCKPKDVSGNKNYVSFCG